MTKIFFGFCFFMVISVIAGFAHAQTVGAPPINCWVPESETAQAIEGACANGLCEEMLPAGLGVCYDGVVMIPFFFSPTGECLNTVPGQLPGDALSVPANYYNPSNPYQPPVCFEPIRPNPPRLPIHGPEPVGPEPVRGPFRL